MYVYPVKRMRLLDPVSCRISFLTVFTLTVFRCVSVHFLCVCKAVDLGEELIRLGHAVSSQDAENGLREDQDEPRSLQKLLV